MSTRPVGKNFDVRQKVKAHINTDLCGLARIGALFHAPGHGHSVFSFAYDPCWLASPSAYEIDPDLQLHPGEAHPGSPNVTFRMFLASAADRWGRLRMDWHKKQRMLKRSGPSANSLKGTSAWSASAGSRSSAACHALGAGLVDVSFFLHA
jgi:serine/threonine-protein kinase HipA